MIEREEVVTRRVRYSVPNNSPLDLVGEAIQKARGECAKLKGVEPKSLYDDDVRVEARDERVAFYFEVEEK